MFGESEVFWGPLGPKLLKTTLDPPSFPGPQSTSPQSHLRTVPLRANRCLENRGFFVALWGPSGSKTHSIIQTFPGRKIRPAVSSENRSSESRSMFGESGVFLCSLGPKRLKNTLDSPNFSGPQNRSPQSHLRTPPLRADRCLENRGFWGSLGPKRLKNTLDSPNFSGPQNTSPQSHLRAAPLRADPRLVCRGCFCALWGPSGSKPHSILQAFPDRKISPRSLI